MPCRVTISCSPLSTSHASRRFHPSFQPTRFWRKEKQFNGDANGSYLQNDGSFDIFGGGARRRFSMSRCLSEVAKRGSEALSGAEQDYDRSMGQDALVYRGHGVKITRRSGRLAVEDHEEAAKLCPTVLVVSSLICGLWPADFYVLAGSELPQESCKGGLVKAIVGRDDQFNRLSSWLLLFETPYQAAAYQHRVCWYLQNTKQNLPVSPIQYIIGPNKPVVPPAGYKDPISGEDVWERIQQFSLYTNTQNENIVPLLSPFPSAVARSFDLYDKWRAKEGLGQCWPLKISAKDATLESNMITRLLENSGGGMEDLINDEDRIAPLRWRPGEIGSSGRPEIEPWIMKFGSEDAALRFWTAWHRREMPSKLGSAEHGLIMVDPLW